MLTSGSQSAKIRRTTLITIFGTEDLGPRLFSPATIETLAPGLSSATATDRVHMKTFPMVYDYKGSKHIPKELSQIKVTAILQL